MAITGLLGDMTCKKNYSEGATLNEVTPFLLYHEINENAIQFCTLYTELKTSLSE